jgi:5'(3')-deoxyribonucleotidase
MTKRRYFIDMDGVIAEWGTEGYTEKGYFATRPLMKNMVDAVKQMISEGKDVYVLSAVLQDNHSAGDKHSWLDEIFGDLMPMEHRIFVPYGECKADYITQFSDSENVLIDDYNDNLFAWRGVAIKFLNGINGGSRVWKGHSICYNWQPAMIVHQINQICAAS